VFVLILYIFFFVYSSRFSSIAWSKMANRATDYSYGLIAAGMVDGTINVWDPAKLVADHDEPLIASVEQHTGAIFGLDFNPHAESSHLLASGGSDGEVYVLALDRPETPNVFVPAPPPNNAKHTADITKVRWNSQVAHILASSAQNGSTIVWDLRQKKAWCELRDPSGCSVSDISWNPDQGLHLVTAGGDDKNPVIKLWDLRSSTSLPLATLQGHREGILSISWCPNDPSLLLSCGKDNRTMLWDLFNLQPVYDLPTGGVMNEEKAASSNGSDSMFGGLTSAVGNRR
jgi:protein transport protein SEC31